ncbi:MAG: SDR family NAD(P)-dependent oxidoreductase [Bacteroidales bacterium]|nr:SDR family NAD(P)-dependent oxidoreductase [Bacteroidales bacterium]
MNASLEKLIEISREYGKNKDFVLGGGGNTSFKDDRYLWIKASGVSLADITEEGFVQLDRGKLAVIAEASYSEDSDERERQVMAHLHQAIVDPEKGKRPSVETSLHNLIAYTYVVHMHPWLVNALLCARNSARISHEIFGDEALYIGYTDPGYVLFKKLSAEIEKYRQVHGKDPQIILLENHGIFISADTTEEIRKLYQDVFERISSKIPRKFSFETREVPDHAADVLPAIRMALSEQGLKIVSIRNNTLIEHFAEDQTRFQKVSLPFTPDQIVYCKAKYIYIPNAHTAGEVVSSFLHQLERFRQEFGYDPKIILIKGMGLAAVDAHYNAVQTALDVYEDLMKISYFSEFFGGPRFMTMDQISFIDHWEVENYRRKVSISDRQGRLNGKIALVTGAAQGFGNGIARGLFHENAHVVIADINDEAGQQLADELNSKSGKNKSLFVHADVSDPESVKKMIKSTVLAFGGIDILISNAGILQAGSLDEMEPDVFERITRINYMGYYLCAKYASRIMKIQHEQNPGHFMDIIQINSKSGLRGSNKNFAYAGGKFGGIGLTESFALELIPYRIKVNSICPGNFFEGPLWSDPRKGLFVQYLQAGKVPGAKTIEDVKAFYEQQVPAGRGCRVEDVMKAILYAIEQEYETGQAIPVTGGQVMLK